MLQSCIVAGEVFIASVSDFSQKLAQKNDSVVCLP